MARHRVLPEEAEQVILHDPVDLGLEVVEREERYLNLGATVRGRVLLVMTTWREDRVRVVTAFEAIKRLIQFYYQLHSHYGTCESPRMDAGQRRAGAGLCCRDGSMPRSAIKLDASSADSEDWLLNLSVPPMTLRPL